LTVMQRDVAVILARYVAAQRQQVVMAFEGWWDKYSVTLTRIEQDRATASALLSRFMSELGYVK
jgi:type I restriction enzyme M protein